jgi:hypothetical protein
MPQQLMHVTLDEVSLVDSPANQLAKVVLTKRADVEKLAGVKFIIGFKEGGGSEVQSVIFDKAWDKAKAEAWLKDHDMASGKLDETDSKLRYRQQDPEGYTRLRTITPGAQLSKALKQSQSFSTTQALIANALSNYMKAGSAGNAYGPTVQYPFIRDLFDDSVVYEMDGKCYRADYSINGQEVTFDTPVQVEIAYQDVKKAGPTQSSVHVNKPMGDEEDMEDPEHEAAEASDEEAKEKAKLKKLQERISGASSFADRLSKAFEQIASQT